MFSMEDYFAKEKKFTVSERTLSSIKQAVDVLPYKDLNDNGVVLCFTYWLAL